MVVNGKDRTVDCDPEMPLLWVLRDLLGLTGIQYGCGQPSCGACAVLLDGAAVHACATPVRRAEHRSVITIEGLSKNGAHPLQAAWRERNIPRCDCCHASQIMTAAAFSAKRLDPTKEDLSCVTHGNTCRCSTYGRIREAIKRAAGVTAMP